MTVNPSFNDWLTDVSNCYRLQKRRITKGQKNFLRIAYDVNVVQMNYFCQEDFVKRGYSKTNFRQYKLQLKDIIVKIDNGHPAFYILKGLYVNSLTKNYTLFKVSDEWKQIVRDVKSQPASMHDFRITTRIDGLYDALIKVGKIPNRKNKGITLDIPNINPRIKTKIVSYANNRFLVMIACTNNPISYSPSGFSDLTEYLTRIQVHLELYTQKSFSFAPIREWILSHIHFNKDKQYNSPYFNYAIEDHEEHSRIYLHELDDGSKVVRWEQIQTPNTPLEDEETKSRLMEIEQQQAKWYDDTTEYPVEFKKARDC